MIPLIKKQDFISISSNYKSQFLFKEPISKKWSIDLEHLYKLNIGSQDRNTNDINSITREYDIPATEFSNYFDNLKLLIEQEFIRYIDIKKTD